MPVSFHAHSVLPGALRGRYSFHQPSLQMETLRHRASVVYLARRRGTVQTLRSSDSKVCVI